MVTLSKPVTASLRPPEIKEATPPERVESLSQQATLADANLEGYADSDYLKQSLQYFEMRTRMAGEAKVRQELAIKRREQALTAVAQGVEEASLLKDNASKEALIAYAAYMNTQSFEGALEDGYASELSDRGTADPVMQATIEDQGFIPTDIVRDNMAKATMLDNFIQKIESRADTRGMAKKIYQFGVRLIPVVDTIQSNKITKDTDVKALFNATNINKSIAKVESMTPLEFYEFLDQIEKNIDSTNMSYAMDFLHALDKGDRSAGTYAGLIELLDATVFLGPLAKIIKGSAKGLMLLKYAGGRDAAVEASTSAFRKELADPSAASDEVIEAILPEGFQPTEELVTGISGKLGERIGSTDDSIQNVLNTVVTERLAPDQYAKAEAKAKEDLIKSFKYKDPEIEDWNTVIDPVNQVRTIYGRFGNKGQGYVSASGATKAAMRTFKMKKGTFEVVQEDNGTWMIQVQRHVAETGNQISAKAWSVDSQPKANWFTKWLFSADYTLQEDLVRSAHLSASAQASIQLEYGRMLKNLKGLNKGQRNNLEIALKSSEQRQKWFTLDELKALYKRQDVKLTDKEILSYYTLKQLNDLDWMIRNSEVVKELAIRGHRKIHIDAPKFNTKDFPTNGIVREEVKNPELYKFYDAETGRSINKGEMNSAYLESLIEKGYRIVEPSAVDPRAFKNENVKFVLVKDEHMSDTILDPIQLPYVAGGHRNYAGKWFIKQANRVEGAASGDVIYLRPLTHHAGDDIRALKEHAAALEEVRLAYIDDTLSQAQKDLRIREAVPELDYAKFDALVKKEQVKTDTPFEVVEDRKAPKMLEKDSKNQGARAWEGDDMPGAVDYYTTDGRMYYGHKGETLPDVTGQPAPLVDPYQTASKAMSNSLRLQAFRNYQFKAVENWAETYAREGWMDIPAGATPYDIFKSGVFNKNAPDYVVRQAETNRMHINALLGQKTATAERWEQATLDFGTYLQERWGLTKTGNFVIDKGSRDPLTAMRSFVFDAKLGFFDPSQMLLQVQTSVAAVTIDPANGWKAMSDAPLLQMALINKTNALRSHLAANGYKVTGTKADEFNEMLDILQATGIADVGTDLSIIDDLSVPQVFNNAVLRGAQAFREKGRIFFYQSERYNKLVGFGIAYRRWKAKNPEVSLYRKDGKLDPNLMEQIVRDTDTFSVNMTRASNALWQRGPASIPTQFASYQARLLELMVGKQLTPAEKSRLLAGQVLLYGSATIPPVLGAKSLYENAVGGVAPDGVIEDTLQNGLWDSVIFPTASEVLLGGPANTEFAARAGLFGNASLITEMWDPEKPFWELMGGAVFSTGSQSMDAFVKMGRLAHVMNSQEAYAVTMDALSDIAGVTSTWSRAERGLFALKTDMYMSRSGRLISEVNPQEAVLITFGIPIKQVQDYYDAALDVRTQKRAEGKVSAAIRKLNIEAATLYGQGDQAGAERKVVYANTILRIYTNDDPLEMARILKSSFPEYSNAYYQAMQQLMEYESLKGKAERSIERYENTRE